jgi:hypothetical protein
MRSAVIDFAEGVHFDTVLSEDGAPSEFVKAENDDPENNMCIYIGYLPDFGDFEVMNAWCLFQKSAQTNTRFDVKIWDKEDGEYIDLSIKKIVARRIARGGEDWYYLTGDNNRSYHFYVASRLGKKFSDFCTPEQA